MNVLQFRAGELSPEALSVTRIEGVEALSTPYRFEVELVSRKPDIDASSLVGRPGALGWKAPVRMRDGANGSRLQSVHGMVSRFRQCGRAKEWTRYRAVVVPRLWKLALHVTTRIFMDKTLPEIVGDVMKEAGFSSLDYEFRAGAGPRREFVVQYQESDLDFVHRWLEHEGIAYFFEQTDEGDKVVFVDATSAYPSLAGAVRYRPEADGGSRVAEGGDWFKEEVVQSFDAEWSVVSKKVVLNDYNWRRPSESLRVESEVAEGGTGAVYAYGDHYKDTGEGKALARVRAEELGCRRLILAGTSDHKSFRSGTAFALSDHYRSEFNAEHLLVEVRHHATQALGLEGSGVTGASYGNEFVAHPKESGFRPARRTPWPSIHGVMHARVDAGGDGQYAEIDDQGRYKVVLPFDLSGRSGGKASRYVRMMQPYAGGGMGMHFPLHKGTEVLLAFLDGDPDRPLILGAVPNAESASPVTGANASQCRIQTGGGNSIVIEDTDGGQKMRFYSPHCETVIEMGAP